MADHNKPVVTDNYTDVLSHIRGVDDDQARMFDPATTTPTNLPTGAIRWNGAQNRFEKWSGSAWGVLTSALNMSAEWTAETIAQSEAEAGTATTRRAWTAQRVRQAIAAWWGAAKGSLVGPIALASGGFSIARTAVTAPAASDGNVYSGTYTPSLSTVGNVASATASACQYMRVGNVVTVSGRLLLTPTAANTSTRIRISLPVASNLSAPGHLSGTSCIATTVVAEMQAGNGSISADTEALIDCAPLSTSSRSHHFTFTYQVI
jgi:hypothetical protein